MKKLILSVLAVFAIAAVVVGCGSSNTASSGNTELEGTWKRIGPGDTSIAYTFSGNNWTMTATAGSESIQMGGTFTINPTSNPKTIDIVYVYSVPANSSAIGKTALGIYELNGISLKLYINGVSSSVRPTAFPVDTMPFVKQ
jgi:uncharacterized protein (TIGR03067 family)